MKDSTIIFLSILEFLVILVLLILIIFLIGFKTNIYTNIDIANTTFQTWVNSGSVGLS